MTKCKIFFSTLLLTLAVLLYTAPTAYADTGKLTMTVESSEITHGDTVLVTVSSNQAFQTRGAGITITYDAALKPIPAKSTVKTGFRISGDDKPLTVGDDTVIRISAFPGTASHTVAAGEHLAVLAFSADKPGEEITIAMPAAYLYDEALEEIQVSVSDPLQLTVGAIPVEALNLDFQELTMEKESTTRLTATILPENASDQTVVWTSSDPAKVKVEDGLLTALDVTTENTPVIITAAVGGLTKSCEVTVVYPPDVGYVVSVPASAAAAVGEEIQIPLTVKNTNTETVKQFNAFDITLTYDPQVIQITDVEGPEDTTMTVEDREGTIQILGYGKSQTLADDTGATAFTLKIRALSVKNSDISIVNNARVDNSANAVLSNAAKATLETGKAVTRIVVDNFTVKLPRGYKGDSVVYAEEPYVFWDEDTENRPYYDYIFSGKMGSTDLDDAQVIRNEDGTFSIHPVTGNLEITVTRTGKKYPVTLGMDISGSSEARFGKDYEVKLDRETGFQYVVDIFIDGKYYSRMHGDSYTIRGADIRGPIEIRVTKTFVGSGSGVTNYSVTFQGSGAEDAFYSSTTVAYGDSYTFELRKQAGFAYSVKYRIGTGKEKRITPVDGYYTVDNVTGNLVITVEKTEESKEFRLEIRRYLTLDNSRVFYLVLVYGNPDDDECFVYEDDFMYYSEAYGAWCILISQEDTLTPAAVRKKITVQPGRTELLEGSVYDVNMTDRVDVNDAQLVYDIYNGKYPDFTKIDMQRFLNADLNGDWKIAVDDVTAVVAQIR